MDVVNEKQKMELIGVCIMLLVKEKMQEVEILTYKHLKIIKSNFEKKSKILRKK
jgi:predicted small secreted protein